MAERIKLRGVGQPDQEFEISEVIGPDQESESSLLVVERDRIPAAEQWAAHAHILQQPERKLQYRAPHVELPSGLSPVIGIPEDLPPALVPLLCYVPSLADKFVAKRYNPGIDSKAFLRHGLHQDPDDYYRERFNSVARLCLMSLSGLAITFMRWREDEALTAVVARPNTIMKVRRNPWHATTEPLSEAALDHFCETKELDLSLGVPGPRTFFFGGVDCVTLGDQLVFDITQSMLLQKERKAAGVYDAPPAVAHL